MKGKLIVIEGLDGSGKSTQIECLKNKLNGKNVHRIKLPDYDSESSALVKMYLRGDFGKTPVTLTLMPLRHSMPLTVLPITK